MANYIFFDIDGVLNSEEWYMHNSPGNLEGQDNDLDPKCIERLNKICSETGAYLVMSSDWRYDFVYFSFFNQRRWKKTIWRA